MKESTNSILVLDEYCPFADHLYDLEKERQEEGRFEFVVFPGVDGWRIRAVNVSSESFALRKQLLPGSLGLRGEELCTSCGVAGCVFVHVSGFMGINETKEGALEMLLIKHTRTHHTHTHKAIKGFFSFPFFGGGGSPE